MMNIFALQTFMTRRDGIRTDGMSEGKTPMEMTEMKNRMSGHRMIIGTQGTDCGSHVTLKI